jgi:cupin fold WbuC family metalloprotein
MKKITQDMLERTSEEAKALPRKRKHCNIHESYSDPVQRLLNAIEPGTYIRPHRHKRPDKTELFLALRGRAVAVQFDDTGKVVDHMAIGEGENGIGVEFPPGSWHTFLSLKSGTVLFEVKNGPFIENTDKNFAKWAPAEGAKEAPEFIKKILKELGL